MKSLVELKQDGLESLMGENVTFYCSNYIYTGNLVGVSETEAKIKDPKIVYRTGSYGDKEWDDAQSLCTEFFYLSRSFMESFGVLNKK